MTLAVVIRLIMIILIIAAAKFFSPFGVDSIAAEAANMLFFVGIWIIGLLLIDKFYNE